MEILEAIRSRRSIRTFKPDPVPKRVLEELLETCLWAPSSRNTQPWEFAIFGGKVMDKIKARLEEEAKKSWEGSDFITGQIDYKNIHPDIPRPELPELYFKRAIDLRDTIDSYQFPPGTENLNEKRHEYLLSGIRFRDAPNGIIIYTEKALYPLAIVDVGVMIKTICLAALAYGLGTCIMQQVVFWPHVLREELGIPESKLIVDGIGIGYPDLEARGNNFPRHREPLDAFAHWHGV